MINATLFVASAFVSYHGFRMIIDYLARLAPNCINGLPGSGEQVEEGTDER